MGASPARDYHRGKRSGPQNFKLKTSNFKLREAPRFSVSQLDEVPPVPCPCGQAARSFADVDKAPASVHLVDIKRDSEAHFHKKTTEIYVVLEGEGHLEADGEHIPLKPLTSVMIQPGCIHRAVGEGLKILNIPIPSFDPDDEYVPPAEAN